MLSGCLPVSANFSDFHQGEHLGVASAEPEDILQHHYKEIHATNGLELTTSALQESLQVQHMPAHEKKKNCTGHSQQKSLDTLACVETLALYVYALVWLPGCFCHCSSTGHRQQRNLGSLARVKTVFQVVYVHVCLPGCCCCCCTSVEDTGRREAVVSWPL